MSSWCTLVLLGCVAGCQGSSELVRPNDAYAGHIQPHAVVRARDPGRPPARPRLRECICLKSDFQSRRQQQTQLARHETSPLTSLPNDHPASSPSLVGLFRGLTGALVPQPAPAIRMPDPLLAPGAARAGARLSATSARGHEELPHPLHPLPPSPSGLRHARSHCWPPSRADGPVHAPLCAAVSSGDPRQAGCRRAGPWLRDPRARRTGEDLRAE